MSRPTDEQLLAFLEGHADEETRAAILHEMDRDPALAERVRAAASGLERVHAELGRGPTPTGRRGPKDGSGRRRARPVSPWWIPAAAAAAVLVTVPATLRVADLRPTLPPVEDIATGMPRAPDPTFVLVLHGRWPDATTISAEETRRRADEYWGWTSTLATDGHLVAAGDLRWEPGTRLAPGGSMVQVAASAVEQPDFLVGMFALRADSYEAAMAIAADCPHLRYGGSVSVRRVGGGFVTVPGGGDWTE